MQELSKERLETLNKRVKNLFGLELSLLIKFDLKGTCTIGQCKKLEKNSYLIRLHDPLLQHYKSIYLDDVLTHEVAHAVQMQLYNHKVKPHGIEWISIIQKLENRDYNPKLRPKYEKLKELIEPKNYRRYAYTCSCNKEHFLSSIRHNRAKNGTIYLCKWCKSPLKQILDFK